MFERMGQTDPEEYEAQKAFRRLRRRGQEESRRGFARGDGDFLQETSGQLRKMRPRLLESQQKKKARLSGLDGAARPEEPGNAPARADPEDGEARDEKNNTIGGEKANHEEKTSTGA